MKLCSVAIHKAGWPFVGIAALVTLLLGAVAGDWAFVLGLILTAWCAYFFRNPERTTPKRTGLVVSPADGKVIFVDKVVPEPDLGLGSEPLTRISIFLNIFDVHINRIPANGKIISTKYRAGKFLHAASDKASVDNERMAINMELQGDHLFTGKILGFVQIAGLVARRIVCDVKEGEQVLAGRRYGLIRFGSRADIYLPDGLQPLVCVGQYMIGGETVLADCKSTEIAREGETT